MRTRSLLECAFGRRGRPRGTDLTAYCYEFWTGRAAKATPSGPILRDAEDLEKFTEVAGLSTEKVMAEREA